MLDVRIRDLIARRERVEEILEYRQDVGGAAWKPGGQLDARLAVQAVGPRISTYFDRPWVTGETRGSSLVVIGEKGLDQKAIQQALAG